MKLLLVIFLFGRTRGRIVGSVGIVRREQLLDHLLGKVFRFLMAMLRNGG